MRGCMHVSTVTWSELHEEFSIASTNIAMSPTLVRMLEKPELSKLAHSSPPEALSPFHNELDSALLKSGLTTPSGELRSQMMERENILRSPEKHLTVPQLALGAPTPEDPAEPTTKNKPFDLKPLELHDVLNWGGKTLKDLNTDSTMTFALLGKIRFTDLAEKSTGHQLGINGALGGIAAYALYKDSNAFLDSKTKSDSYYYAAASVADFSATAGAAMSYVPALRKYSAVPLALGYTGRVAIAGVTGAVNLATDLIHK